MVGGAWEILAVDLFSAVYSCLYMYMYMYVYINIELYFWRFLDVDSLLFTTAVLVHSKTAGKYHDVADLRTHTCT